VGNSTDGCPTVQSLQAAVLWYADADSDGYGDPAVSQSACEAPAGYVGNSGDGCPTVQSLQAAVLWYADADIDGQGDPAVSVPSCTPVAGYVSNSTDLCPLHQGVFAPSDFWPDTDGDGYGAGTAVSECVAGGGRVPNNTDGCPTVAALQAPATWYRDVDGDGVGTTSVTDTACEQPKGFVAGAGDLCDDEPALQAPVSYFVDGDRDGYGSNATALRCDASATDGYSSVDGDCDDANEDVHEDITYYGDSDADGFGDPADAYDVCSDEAPDGYVANSGDLCPTDTSKNVSTGQCGCNLADTDSDGDGYADCVDATPGLRLVARNSGVFASGDGYVTVDVELGARLSTQPTVGAQLVLQYNRVLLSFVSAEPGSSAAGNGLFSQPVFLNHTASTGTIQYSVGVADTFSGGTGATRVATLTFRVADGVNAICAQPGLVEFVTTGSPVTKLSGTGGVAILPTTFDLGSITAYSASVGFQSLPSAWTRPADAGLLGSVYAEPTVSYIAPCVVPAGTSPVTVEHDLPGGGTDWVSGWPAGGLFPVGATTVRWTADGQSETRTFEVQNHQVMELSVALDGGLVLPNSRTLSVPVTSGYGCVSVKNATHTLGRTADVSVSGTKYVASFAGANRLLQGNSDGDSTIDILDFGVYVEQFGAGKAANALSNFDGDTFVDSADFSFISFNFFQVESAGCPGSSLDGGVASGGPMDRVSVRELRRMGRGELVIADLNGDGWLDTEDMALWMQGTRPKGYGE